jgi:hypothetical protein
MNILAPFNFFILMLMCMNAVIHMNHKILIQQNANEILMLSEEIKLQKQQIDNFENNLVQIVNLIGVNKRDIGILWENKFKISNEVFIKE